MRTIFDVITRDKSSAANKRIAASMKGMGASARTAEAGMRGAGVGMRGALGGMKSGFEMMAVGGGLMKVGGGLVSALGGAEKIAGEFSYRMAAVGTVARATAVELKMLGQAAKQAGIDTQYTPIEAAEALQTLAQAGFNVKQQMDTLRPSLDLAAGSAGQLGVADAANVITQSIKGYGVAMKDTGLATDQLLRSTQMFSIQSKDLPLGLGNTARGAQTMNQSLSESLITFGLIRNIIPRVATASMAAGISMERMADPRVQQKLKAIKVEVDDGAGGFRSYLDVVTDLIPRLDAMTEIERGKFVQQTFGMEGARGVLAIMAQLKTGIQTTTGEVLKGAAAIEYYRKELGNSAGTAEALREALLETSEGQKKLLEGSKMTAAISIGGALAALFKPIVKAQIGTLNTFIMAFDSLPPIARQVMVGFTGVAGVFMKVLGAAVLVGGAMRMLGISFTGLLLTMGKMLLISIPLMGFIGALGIGFYGLYRATQKNVGGMSTSFSGLWSKIKTGFKGTIDLISGGGLSEAVKEDLKKAENQGVGKFLTWMAGAIGKAKAFFGGLVDGFDAGLKRLEGPFTKFKNTLLGMFGLFTGSDVQSQLDGWANAGEKLGDKFADLSIFAMEFAVDGLGEIKEAFKDISLEDVQGGLENMLTIMQGIATAMTAIADAYRGAKDFFTAWGTVGAGSQDLTPKQMIARVNLAAGEEAGGLMKGQFDVFDMMVEQGFLDRGMARQMKERLSKQQTLTSEDSLKLLTKTGIPEEVREERNKQWGERIDLMTKLLDKIATKDTSVDLTIDGERFGTLVGSVFDTKEEREYEESIYA